MVIGLNPGNRLSFLDLVPQFDVAVAFSTIVMIGTFYNIHPSLLETHLTRQIHSSDRSVVAEDLNHLWSLTSKKSNKTQR